MEDVLLWDLHHSNCPALIGIFSVESLVNGAHCSFSELLGKAIGFVGIVWQEMNLLYLFIKVTVANQSIIRYFFFFLEPGHDLNHHLRIFLNEFSVDIVFGEKLHHIRGEALDAARTI